MTTLAARPAPVRLSLAQLKRGDRAIVELDALPQEDSQLLAAMGLADRAEVRVCRSGSTCIVQVEATRLGISAAMAARILATPCACYPDDAAARG
jgi:Fe2+ transport system protein FeoA